MVKDKKVDVIARDYTINLHKAQLIALDAHCLEPTLADR